MSFIIPQHELSLAEMRTFREKAASAGIRRALKLGIAGSEGELQIRQAIQSDDFGAALDQWNTAALAVIGTAYSVFQAAPSPTLVANKLWVAYGVSITTAPVPVSRLEFRMGSATGNLIAEFDLEQIVNGETVEGYFSQPIPIDPQATFACQVICSIATGVFARVVLRNWLIEPIGQTIA